MDVDDPVHTIVLFLEGAGGSETRLCEVPVPSERWRTVVRAILGAWRETGHTVRAEVRGRGAETIEAFGYDPTDYPE
ncbi:MAG: hypothetical protein Kow0067_12660 [Coriobacteriia bacterium]